MSSVPPRHHFWLRLFESVKADLFLLMYWAGHLVPKNPHLWVFGSGHGESFTDNSRQLFLHAATQHCETVRCVWLTRNPTTLAAIRALGFEAYHMYGARGCWLSLRAAIAIVSYDYSLDLNPFAISKATRLVQLWHGTPLKKLGADDKFDANRVFPKPKSLRCGLCHHLKLQQRRFFWKLFPRRQADLLIAASDEVARVLAGLFQLPRSICKVTGYPRNDAIFSPPCLPPIPDHKRAIYLPTWRGTVFERASFFEFDVKRLDELLARHKLVLYFKPHPVSLPRPEFLAQLKEAKNIRLLETNDLYGVLSSFDALVTDYSSIYFDYLLLDRPIVFLAGDLENYKTHDHELYYDYDSVTPGPKVSTWEQMVIALAEELAAPQRHAAQRKTVRDKFNAYSDAHSSERVFREILHLASTP